MNRQETNQTKENVMMHPNHAKPMGPFCCGKRSPKDHVHHGLFWGGTLVLFGILFLLEHLGHLGTLNAWDFWPLLLLLGGMLHLLEKGKRVFGLLLFGIGVLALGHTLSFLDIRWGLLWPVAVIGLGVYTVYTVFTRKHATPSSTTSAGRVEGSAIMGGREDRNDSPEFEGGEVSAVMGAYELDLTRAGMKGDQVTLVAKAVMGSVEIRTPAHWRVNVQGTPVLGSVEDRCVEPPADVENPKTLVIQASAVLGSVEIRN
jgi:predicted membrane protein